MAFQLKIARGPRMVVAEVTALAFVEDADGALREIELETRAHGDRRLLINLLDVVGTFASAEQQHLGRLVARRLEHLEKVASLVPFDKATGVSEKSARAQGMELRVFVSLGDAVTWLLE